METTSVHPSSASAGIDRSDRERSSRGHLAPWQLRRALEIMNAHVDSDVRLTDLARECDVSVSHFVRAFHRSVGVPPHRWLLQRRIAVAKELLAQTPLSIAEIASSCGFCDQSHFTRTFSKTMGVSPGLWRRSLGLHASLDAPAAD